MSTAHLPSAASSATPCATPPAARPAFPTHPAAVHPAVHPAARPSLEPPAQPQPKPPGRLRRLAVALAAVLGGVVLVGGAVVSVYAMHSLPKLSGQTTLAGLSAGVSVRRDQADVTHILATQPLDAYRALGMVHAQERPWQLALNRRVMHGTLSEVFGPVSLPVDKLMRTLGIAQAAQAQWAGLPPDAKEVLQAYADGINAHMASGAQADSPEFKLLGLKPQAQAAKGEFWTPQDSVGWALMMALDLGGNWGTEFARFSSAQAVDTAALWQLFPPYAGEAPASATDLAALYRSLGVYATPATTPAVSTSKKEAGYAVRTSAAGHSGAETTDPASSAIASVQQWADGLGHVEGKGSNNWVVAGQASASGQPLLANDPHLGLSAPAIWYFARLQSPAGQGAQAAHAGLDVTGATLPGLPFVVLGRNAHVAWGFTNTGPDVQDLYLEAINPANPAQYRVPAPAGQTAWADFATRVETIRVKGQPDVSHTVRSTRHGPVLSDAQASHAQVMDTSRFVLALRWAALDADNHTVLAGLEGAHARSTDELLGVAYRHYHSPMQNVVAADTAGRVAYKAAGRVPTRALDNDLRGVAPAPGWEARYDWTGWIPYAETPEARFGTPANSATAQPAAVTASAAPAVDTGVASVSAASATATAAQPRHAASDAQAAASAQAQQRGWLATANQRIHAPDYPHFITQDWATPDRQQRIEQLLAAQPRHTPESLAAIQGDVLSLASVRLLPHLRAAAQASTHPLAAALRTELAGFDGTMSASRAAPLVLAAWADELTRSLITPRLGEARMKMLYGKRHFRVALEHMLASNDPAWCNGPQGCADVARQALDATLQRLQPRHGRDLSSWRWGDAHPAVSRHSPFSQVAALAPLFEVRVPTGGDPFTVNVGQYQLDNPAEPYANRHAASLRAIYDLANLENSRFIYQTGQSGNAFSSRYSDMARQWRDVSYRPLQLQPARWRNRLDVLPAATAASPAQPQAAAN